MPYVASSRSMIKPLGFTMLAACSVSACAAPRVACPPQHNADGKTRALAGASVFEGPPQNLVDLMPDLDTSEWDISMNQRAAKGRGESMYLVCRYEGLAATVTLPVPDGATFCKVEGAATVSLRGALVRASRSGKNKIKESPQWTST